MSSLTSSFYSLHIDWHTQNPVFLLNLIPSESISDIRIVVVDGFNSAAPIITMGTQTIPDLLVKAQDINLKVAGDYNIAELHFDSEETEPLYLFVNPNGATTGELIIRYCICNIGTFPLQ